MSIHFKTLYPGIEVCWDANPRIILSSLDVLDVRDFYSRSMDILDEIAYMDEAIFIMGLRFRDDGDQIDAALIDALLFHKGEIKGKIVTYPYRVIIPNHFTRDENGETVPMYDTYESKVFKDFDPGEPKLEWHSDHGLHMIIRGEHNDWAVTYPTDLAEGKEASLLSDKWAETYGGDK